MLDAVVIGAGLAGAAAAWELSRRGRAVLVLERFEAGHHRGSSHGTERIVRLGYTSPEYVELGLEAMAGWRALEGDSGQALLHLTGAIDHGYDDELDELAAAYDACGVRHEWLTPADAHDCWPGLRFEGPVLHQPDGGWVRADEALRSFLTGAERRGAELRFGAGAAAIEPSEEHVRVVTGGEVIEARCVVVAAGAWSATLLGDLVALPPILVTKQQVAYLRPLDRAAVWPCFIHRSEPLHYGLPTPDGLVKLGDHGNGPVVDPDDRDFEVEPALWAALLADVEQWLPGVHPEPVRSLTCLYASTPTDDFVLDRVGPLVVAAGLGGHGFKFGPAIGRMLADLVDGTIVRAGPFALGGGAVAGPGRSGSR